MSIAEKLKEDTKQIWDKITSHPFMVELCEGNLARDKFKFFILQDYHYLVSAIRNFSIIASKAEKIKDIIEVIQIGYIASASEYKSYLKLLNSLGLSIEDAQNTKPSSIVLSYTNFLFSISRKKSFTESLVSILPCFWSYGDAVKCNNEKLCSNTDEIYLKWTEVYLSKKYFQLMVRLQNLIDRVSVNFNYNKLKKIFIKSSRYEYMYWDGMYSFKK